MYSFWENSGTLSIAFLKRGGLNCPCSSPSCPVPITGEKCHPSPCFLNTPLVWSLSFRENQVLGTLLDCAAGPVSSGCPVPPAGHQAGSKFSATAYRRPTMWGWFIDVYTSHKWVSEIDYLLGLPHHSTTYPIWV